MDLKNSLLIDLYELTMAQSYLAFKPDTLATFELFARQMPAHRNYLIACGIDEALEYCAALRFSKDDIAFLRGRKIFSGAFLDYLGNFSFKGQVWAVPEGTVSFAQEPLIRVTAPIIQAQIIESFLLNTVNLSTMIASKASRVAGAARGRSVFDFSLRRTHGTDAALKVSRAAYIAGCAATANVLAGKRYGIPVVGTMAHSFVMSFASEMQAFLAYAQTFPDKTILLVDTYDSRQGIDNAVAVGKYLKERGHSLAGIRLDSGDLAALSRVARKLLDKADLAQAKIFASGDLDEYKIAGLLARGACIDGFGVGTHMGASIDAPALDVIYKISEVTDEQGEFLPTMKLSRRKATYPGRKQVFRQKDARGGFLRDVLGLEGEKIHGEPLLRLQMDKGRRLQPARALAGIRESVAKSLLSFAPAMRSIDSRYRYPLVISPGLQRLRRRITGRLKARQ